MEDYKGKVLHYDGGSFNATIAAHYKVIKVINEAAAAYEELDTTFKFTEEVLAEMLAKNITPIKERYAQVIEDQIRSSKFTSKAVIESMKARIDADINELYVKIEKISDTIHTLGQHESWLNSIHFSASNIAVIDGKAIFSKEAEERVKDLCEAKIRTDVQNEFYNLCLNAQQSFSKVVEFLQEHKPQIVQGRAMVSDKGHGVFSVVDNILCINWSYVTNI